MNRLDRLQSWLQYAVYVNLIDVFVALPLMCSNQVATEKQKQTVNQFRTKEKKTHFLKLWLKFTRIIWRGSWYRILMVEPSDWTSNVGYVRQYKSRWTFVIAAVFDDTFLIWFKFKLKLFKINNFFILNLKLNSKIRMHYFSFAVNLTFRDRQ